MPVVTFNYYDFISLLGKEIEKDVLLERIPMIGAGIERIEGDEISIEIFPDRPDMLSVEGLARAIRSFLGIEKGMKKYEIKQSDISLKIEKSVEKVRPYIAGAVVRNIIYKS